MEDPINTLQPSLIFNSNPVVLFVVELEFTARQSVSGESINNLSNSHKTVRAYKSVASLVNRRDNFPRRGKSISSIIFHDG